MSADYESEHFKMLVVHHDAIVRDDLCEALSEEVAATAIDGVCDLSQPDLRARRYDAAVIELARNASIFEKTREDWSGALGRIVWIVDDAEQPPVEPEAVARLVQPFRTRDVVTALRTAGILQRFRQRRGK